MVVSSGATIPARAPPSIDMLQSVMRPSMLSARIAEPISRDVRIRPMLSMNAAPPLTPPPSEPTRYSTSCRASAPRSATATSSGRPVPSPSLPVEVRNARTGSLVTSIAPTGTPVAVALSADVLALLEQTPTGMTLAWYDPAGGDALGEIPVPATTTALAAGKGVVAFRVGRSIRVVEASAKRARVLTKAAKTPIGLSVDGLRVAWAENIAGRGRIRAVSVG